MEKMESRSKKGKEMELISNYSFSRKTCVGRMVMDDASNKHRSYLSSKYPVYGFLIWSAQILFFDRHDYGFYGTTFAVSVLISILLFKKFK